MNKKTKPYHWILIPITMSMLFMAQASTFDQEGYRFPVVPPLEATIAGSFFKAPKDLDYETLEIRSLVDTPRKEELELRYYPPQNKLKDQNELAFVFSGIGGDNKGNISNLIADKLAKNGLHSVIVPSVFTEEFAFSFSRTGFVGHMPKDARDMMHALVWVKKTLEKEENIKFQSYKMTGYSLGAISAAHVANYADTTHEASLKFERVVLMNSPIDLLHGLRYIDDSQRNGTDLTVMRLFFGVYRPLIDIFFRFRDTEFITEEIFLNSITELEGLEKNDLKALIARALRSSLGDVIMASQRIHDLGVLPRLPTLRDDMRRRTAIYKRRLDAAEKMSFEQYVKRILVPYYRNVLHQKDYDLKRFNDESSLTAIGPYLKKADHIYFMHNTDDFLLKDKNEIQYIKEVFKNRAVLFPRGGHLGNIWYEKNIEIFLDLMDAN